MSRVLCPASVTRFRRTVEIQRAVTKTIAELVGRGAKDESQGEL